MTYEEFKQLAEHPQHRDVPAIFKLEVLETEELEEKKRSHYPKYKVNTYCPQANMELMCLEQRSMCFTQPRWVKNTKRDIVLISKIWTFGDTTCSMKNCFAVIVQSGWKK